MHTVKSCEDIENLDGFDEISLISFLQISENSFLSSFEYPPTFMFSSSTAVI
jgi:hypothetical protein